jgi:RND superfamily putative drug exporter
VRDAVIRTGSVISSCGIIMAATLGSLWAGGLSLLRQLGFALALGILIDTFFVRPLLIPSFYLVFGRSPARRRHNRGVEEVLTAPRPAPSATA